jgi:riboflavin kinase/FMN adenylyltransferase
VNILGFDGDLYGQTVQVTFVERLRDERKFDSPEALAAQLEQDRDRVNEILGL